MKYVQQRIIVLNQKVAKILQGTDFSDPQKERECYISSESLSMEAQALRQVFTQANEDLEDVILALRVEVNRQMRDQNPAAAQQALESISALADLIRSREGFDWDEIAKALDVTEGLLRPAKPTFKSFSRDLAAIKRSVDQRLEQKYRLLRLKAFWI